MNGQDDNQQDNFLSETGIGYTATNDTAAPQIGAPPTDSNTDITVKDIDDITTAPGLTTVDQSSGAPSTHVIDDLLDMKQQALQLLAPLVDHLDQSPEEKFRTTMMMIQAADDQTHLKSAYETAKQITDEKARAQALLDVVNEINYFTQQHHAN